MTGFRMIERRLLATVGIVVAMLLMVLWHVTSGFVHPTTAVIVSNLMEIEVAVHQARAEHGPTVFEGLTEEEIWTLLVSFEAPRLDPWERPYRILASNERMLILCAGADGVFDDRGIRGDGDDDICTWIDFTN